jgi:signal peptidase I
MKSKKKGSLATPPPPAPEKKQNDPDKPTGIRGFIAEWAVTILLLVFGITLLLQTFVVPTSSMEDTILIGDHMVVDKLAYAPSGVISKYLLPYTPVKRGDIIVFKYPPNIRENYIKRVVGVPGDRIKVVNKDLYINGKKVDEPYVVHKSPYMDSYRDNFPSQPNMPNLEPAAIEMLQTAQTKEGEILVPDNCYFAMGDNRDNSADSRYWGFVPRQNIVGKPVVIFWSYDTTTARLADPNFISLEHILDLATNFFSKTRWRRTFMLIRGYPLQ